MSATNQPGVLGLFAHMDATLAALARLRQAGHARLRVFSPVPRHEIVDAAQPGVSPVRAYALVGAVTGTFAGLALAVWTGIEMNLNVGGKPIVAWPAYFVIGFELTVLIGALATLAGFLLLARLPRARLRRGYDGKFSDDRFGIFVECDPARQGEVKQMLEACGAEEVRVEGS